ncbi:ABC transporter substrate-binding protein [Pseudoxanthomonas wuyuanensis]|uniref:ABC-type Fe3+-hydroxamate transport system, substrate-binding protein n=1 Tax=Pseudoxanthomonas wuyuanensis TaxID=1073196 RepID=A0A286CYQ3_9GAMM|nr:ABC transporter substrate-binding protein [Pseudoxanthomonas wuyuanensis]KAF1722778.1 ABC transporter substrate-binding protein [Pseudoxanthomonas wuyuanensis]SOD51538.1 ABC-type Fe3+-hydroxamate transport system, substrate-binding protein [Pseudoxanthomonas wuyuanensis]
MSLRAPLLGGLLAALAVTGCQPSSTPSPATPNALAGEAIPLRHARLLTLERHQGFVVARLKGAADGADARAKALAGEVLVLLPHESPVPALTGDLRDATVIRTPVQRIASNAGSDEAFLTQLGVEERLVAVGGLASYDDGIRRRAKAGDIGQVGYNWHSPPNLDVLIARQPDVFLMRLSDPAHTPMLERARTLGLTVVPTLAEEEQGYLARAEWIRLYGLLTGTEARADAIFAEVEQRVADLKAKVADRPEVNVLWAYPNGADRWIATVRGAEAAYVADAGGINLLARPEDPQRYSAETLSTEALLPLGERADVWLIGDIHAVAPRNTEVERGFRAWREGRLFGNTGRTVAAENAYDWYQTALVRPDWVLTDFVKALHPDLVSEPFRFLKPLEQGEYR